MCPNVRSARLRGARLAHDRASTRSDPVRVPPRAPASDLAILLIDSDGASSEVLVQALRGHGCGPLVQVADGAQVVEQVRRQAPDVVLYNHHFDRPDDLLACCTARLYAPEAAFVGLASVGPAAKFLRRWNEQQSCLQAVVEKPLHPGQLAEALREVARQRAERKDLEARAARLAGLVPAGVEQALRAGDAGEDELFEAAVVFTDVRRSTELITSHPPRAFFRLLDESLSAQAAQVLTYGGSVVKYTGDGLLAVFRGTGRAHLALRCALALGEAGDRGPMVFGVGAAKGLVLAGLLGDFGAAGQRRQYDVIGATVHLAARLCAQAQPGQVVATRDLLQAARVPVRDVQSLGAQPVRGFPRPVECVALRGALLHAPDTIERTP